LAFDLIVLFDVNVGGVTPHWLIETLAPKPRVMDVVERCRGNWTQKEWAVETTSRHPGGSVIGPGGFHFRIGAGRLEMYHTTKFRVFQAYEDQRQLLRLACRSIAGVLESPRAIYTHELMPYGDGRLCDVESTLSAEIGPPALTFDELRDADDFKPRAWFVDTFLDLPTDVAHPLA
jgi:hypothetical protein